MKTIRYFLITLVAHATADIIHVYIVHYSMNVTTIIICNIINEHENSFENITEVPKFKVQLKINAMVIIIIVKILKNIVNFIKKNVIILKVHIFCRYS